MKYFSFICICLLVLGCSISQKPSYQFDSSGISKEVLENYLKHSVTMSGFLVKDSNEPETYKEDDIRLINGLNVKFVGRAIYRWGNEDKLGDSAFLEYARQLIKKVHDNDSDVVFQACLFEIVTPKVNELSIPSWTFEALGLSSETRNFDYQRMLDPNGKMVNHWGENSSVPDITQVETQLWLMYIAGTYMQLGCEAIHLGQTALMGMNDPQLKQWETFLNSIREYAKKAAPRGWILLDAHVPFAGMIVDGKSLLDFNTFPMRIKEVPEKHFEAVLESGYLDALYNRSRACITPSGWSCESLPYLVEFDNFDCSDTPGQSTIKSHFIWGYDEISWFYQLSEENRKDWLEYAFTWLRENDSNGYLQMPVTRGVSLCDERGWVKFHANTKSENMPDGLNLEETIKKLWKEYASFDKKKNQEKETVQQQAEMLSLLPENPRYFQFRGKPTLLITSGEHYGMLMNKAFDYNLYLKTLAQYGLNLTRVFSGAYVENPTAFNISNNTLAPDSLHYMAPWIRSDEQGYQGGGNKFDLSVWNPAYFERLHSMFKKASEEGVIIEFVFFCPMYNEDLWNICPMNAQNNIQGIGTAHFEDVYRLNKDSHLLVIQENLVRKIVQELNEYDNLYYEICNEPYFGGVQMDWQHHITDIIVQTEKNLPNKHLISVNVANETAKVVNPHPSWSIFNFHYASPPTAVSDNIHLPFVIGMNETGFHGTKDGYYRREAWEFMLAGGGLYNNLDYSFATGHEDGSFLITEPTPGGGGDSFRKQMGFMKQFLESLDLSQAKPIKDITILIPDEMPKGIIPYGLKSENQYAVYIREWNSSSINFALPSATYNLRIANPANANWIFDKTVNHSGGNLTIEIPSGSHQEIAILVTAKNTEK